MGRIDEALRRAGASKSAASVVNTETDDPFTSPWALDDAPLHPGSPLPSGSPRDGAAPATQRRTAAETTGAEKTAAQKSGASHVSGEVAEPAATSEWRERLTTLEAADPMIAEQFRRLAATLIHSQRTAPLKVIMVTSAAPEEGKTLSALNLALVLSDSFKRRVLLIDADLRRPKITQLANVPGEGLGELVKAAEARKVPLVPLTEMLTLLPAGRPDPDPLSGLTSSRMQHLLQDAGAAYEWVIVDTPPIGAAADASLLCAMADATVLVVRAEETPYEAVQQAIDSIGRDRIIGVILNGVERHDVPSYADYAGRDSHGR